MPIAPHENIELEYVMVGLKPLASLEKDKQPDQFERALKLQHVASVVQHDDNLLTVTRKENKHLHGVFTLLSSKQASILVKSAEEKHRLLGRLFGYSETDIDEFIAAGLDCACGQCEWDKEPEETRQTKLPQLSERTQQVIIDWCAANVPPLVPLKEYNPQTLAALIKDRKDGVAYVFVGGSSQGSNNIFTKNYALYCFRAWHDQIHINYNLDFSLDHELVVAALHEQEAIKMGISKEDAKLLSLDIDLHVRHLHKHGVHPEYQTQMISDYLVVGLECLNNNYGRQDD